MVNSITTRDLRVMLQDRNITAEEAKRIKLDRMGRTIINNGFAGDVLSIEKSYDLLVQHCGRQGITVEETPELVIEAPKEAEEEVQEQPQIAKEDKKPSGLIPKVKYFFKNLFNAKEKEENIIEKPKDEIEYENPDDYPDEPKFEIGMEFGRPCFYLCIHKNEANVNVYDEKSQSLDYYSPDKKTLLYKTWKKPVSKPGFQMEDELRYQNGFLYSTDVKNGKSNYHTIENKYAIARDLNDNGIIDQGEVEYKIKSRRYNM